RGRLSASRSMLGGQPVTEPTSCQGPAIDSRPPGGPMPRRDSDPDFVESIARGIDVLKAFGPGSPAMSLSEVATAADLARPTARRILRTLSALGYVRARDGSFE